MNKINAPLLTILLAIIAGILAYEMVSLELIEIWGCVLISFIAAVIIHVSCTHLKGGHTAFIISTVDLFISIGYLTRYVNDHLKHQDHFLTLASLRPHTTLLTIEQRLKPNTYQNNYVALIKTLDNQLSTGRVLLNVSKDTLHNPLEIGDWIYARASIQPLPTVSNPYQFDYGNYLKRQEIYGRITVLPQQLLASNRTTVGLRVWASRFRESVLSALKSYPFTTHQLAIIEALVLGQKRGINKQISYQYAASGMMHILAVSGLHVGIILLLLRYVLKPIRARKLRWVKSLIIILLIWGFAFITGLSPSVLRAATMFSFLEVGEAFDGKRNSQDAVFTSSLFLLLYDPLLIYQVGFQLSYLAVLAILWIQPWLASFWSPKNFILKKIRDVGSVTIAAQLGVMPLSIYYFHQFPGLFFLSNIIIIPFLGIILGGGIVLCLLAYFGILIPKIAIAYGMVIDLINGFIAWVASQETFVARHITISIAIMATSYICIVSCFQLFKKYNKMRLAFACGSIVFLTGIIFYEKNITPNAHLAILNKSKSSVITQLSGSYLKVFAIDTSKTLLSDARITAYQNALKINTVEQHPIPSYLRYNDKELLVIDSLGVYDLKKAAPHYVILTQSPRINLERLLLRYPEATIIADGSNYKSYVVRWRATCLKQKIPFHSTYEKGAYIIN